jgi:peptide deformylase
MRILTVNNPADKKVLSTVCDLVDFNLEGDDLRLERSFLKETIRDMRVALKESGVGIGLSANQIGVTKRIFIVDLQKTGRGQVFINAEILRKVGEPYKSTEECMSIPERQSVTMRYHTIIVKWYDRNGKKKTGTFTGLEARVIQHERDHGDGLLI